MNSLNLDNSEHPEIAVQFVNVMNEKYETIKNTLTAFLEDLPKDACNLLKTNAEKTCINDEERGSFSGGFLLRYYYSQYRIEVLNAQHRDNLKGDKNEQG